MMSVAGRLLCIAGLSACLFTGQLKASPCEPGSLADYLSDYPIQTTAACEVGTLIYKGFNFVDLTVGGGSLTAVDFGVFPNVGTGGLDFSTPGGLYDNEKYFLSYVVDPAPVLGGEELSMDLSFGAFAAFFAFGEEELGPAVEPTVTASKWACPEGMMAGVPTLPASQGSLSCRSPYAIPTNLPFFMQVNPGESKSVTFPALVFFTHVGILFEFDGDVAPMSVASSPIVISAVPEPAMNLMLAGGLLLLAAARKFRR